MINFIKCTLKKWLPQTATNNTQIKYELIGAECLTICPYKQGKKFSDGYELINYVGSTGCSCCKYFKNDDEEKQIVKCSYGEGK